MVTRDEDHQVAYHSFFLIKLKKRDELRHYLMQKNIYLPIHWPQSSQKHNLYNEVISIPLFSQYNEKEFNYMINTIEDFINERN